jgi:hypothetical protein
VAAADCPKLLQKKNEECINSRPNSKTVFVRRSESDRYCCAIALTTQSPKQSLLARIVGSGLGGGSGLVGHDKARSDDRPNQQRGFLHQ